jgi:hypothetical protein
VTFDSSYDSATGKTYHGTWHANPAFNQAQSDPMDVAVVVLDKPVTGIAPARLPAAGSLDGLGNGRRFTSVGYGAQSVTIDHGPTFHYADIRYVASGGLDAVNKSWLRISMNPARGDGGTCFGDSGGPNFLGAGPPRPTSWLRPPSPATRCVGRPTSTTGWTRRPPGPSSDSTSRCRSRREGVDGRLGAGRQSPWNRPAPEAKPRKRRRDASVMSRQGVRGVPPRRVTINRAPLDPPALHLRRIIEMVL